MVITQEAELKSGTPERLPWIEASREQLVRQLVGRYGEAQRGRLERGLSQVSSLWRAEDGGPAEFHSFVSTNFAGDQATLDAIFHRLGEVLEHVDGHLHEISRVLREPVDLDRGPLLPMDEVLAGYEISAHVLDDLFENKLAFVALLNFPLYPLKEKLQYGQGWNRRQWAEARLVEHFYRRVPADVSLAIARAASEADQYINDYNIWMHHVLASPEPSAPPQRPFPASMRLLSHWGLRDQIKAEYDQPGALGRQRLIQRVLEHIVHQTIPQAVIDNPQVDWNLDTGEVAPAAAKDSDFAPAKTPPLNNSPEPDTRYRMLLRVFQAARLEDPYTPSAPTLIARRFEEGRQIAEDRFAAMLKEVLASPLVPRVAALIERRLGRKLEPFDLWYSGFRPRSRYSEVELDEIVRKRYSTAEDYRKDIPNLLGKLGFTSAQGEYLARSIVVDPARGAGHAMGAVMRGAKTHLRTRVDKNGMSYKGFNVAAHEMGHNVEQVYSLEGVDHYLLQGVPNTAFTEAFAFVFQSRDLLLLDLFPGGEQDESLYMLNEFWGTYEIAGVALVDMAVWHWMYDHPDATSAALKEATLGIARDLWNRYYAPVFQKKDVVLLAVYSHMIDSFLYLPDYPLGHMIAIQIEQHLKRPGTDFGAEVERMVKFGNVLPDAWMKHATGEPVGPDAMLRAAERALQQVQG